MHTLIVLIEKGKKCWNTNARQKHRQQRRKIKRNSQQLKVCNWRSCYFLETVSRKISSVSLMKHSRVVGIKMMKTSLYRKQSPNIHIFQCFFFWCCFYFFCSTLVQISESLIAFANSTEREREKKSHLPIYIFLTNWCRNSRFEMRDSDTVYRYPIHSWIEF